MVSKIGRIPIVLNRPIPGRIKTLTIKRNRAGQFFAVFCCEVDLSESLAHTVPIVAFDQGLAHLLVGSDGTVIDPPKYLRQAEKRLKKRQRRLSKKIRGSKNDKKAKRRLAKLHIHVVNQRENFLHQLSAKLVEKYGVIVVEDLQLSDMVQNHSLAQSINDAGLGILIGMLEYKASEAGSQLIKVDPAYTTQTCSRCGNVRRGKEKIGLDNRTYCCPNCGLSIDRDLNAAINIHRAGLARIHACGDGVRPSLEKAVVDEAGTKSSGGLACPS